MKIHEIRLLLERALDIFEVADIEFRAISDGVAERDRLKIENAHLRDELRDASQKSDIAIASEIEIRKTHIGCEEKIRVEQKSREETQEVLMRHRLSGKCGL